MPAKVRPAQDMDWKNLLWRANKQTKQKGEEGKTSVLLYVGEKLLENILVETEQGQGTRQWNSDCVFSMKNM